MALTDKLTAIGNAIREKTGGAALIPLADMSSEIRSISGGFENDIVFNAVNSTASAYLAASQSYSAADYTVSVAENYASTTTRHDLPQALSLTVPAGAAALTVVDSVSGKGLRQAASGTAHEVKNLIPGRVYHYFFTNSAGGLLKAGSCKATGFLRQIDANRGGLGTFNIRDIGGWSCDGGTIAYGKIFRGSQLNSIYVSTELSAEERAIFKDFLGIRDDIDLRSAAETAGQDRTIGTDDDFTESALGADVDYINLHVSPYDAGVNLSNAVQTGYYQTLLKRVVSDLTANKPCYIHCAEGADRTGTLCALIEALCGVSQTDIDREYELTSLAQNRLRKRSGSDWRALINYITGLRGSSFRDKVLYYALRAGVSIDEVNALRRSLIDGTPETIVNPFAEIYTVTVTTSAHTAVDNIPATVTEGDSYTAHVTAETDYAADVTVTMGGTDITSAAYSSGTISIANVTGNLVITVAEHYTGNLFDKNAATDSARINSGGNAVSFSSGQLVTDFIPATAADTVSVSADKAQTANVYTGMIALYRSDKTYIKQVYQEDTRWTWNAANTAGSIPIGSIADSSETAYVRICIAYTDMDNIVVRK